MLSFFELLIFTTTSWIKGYGCGLLWFAFILWTTDIYNNTDAKSWESIVVVICFHSLNYWYLQQPNIYGCQYLHVVICFHSLNYWYLQQQSRIEESGTPCCDLLSFFELLIFTTTIVIFSVYLPLLWFAFILWTTDIYNNCRVSLSSLVYVVICFHSLNYWYLQQLFNRLKTSPTRCDLLSFFELLIFTTTSIFVNMSVYVLWFAFILWTTDIYNNYLQLHKLKQGVVICFHSLNYWYLQQLYI